MIVRVATLATSLILPWHLISVSVAVVVICSVWLATVQNASLVPMVTSSMQVPAPHVPIMSAIARSAHQLWFALFAKMDSSLIQPHLVSVVAHSLAVSPAQTPQIALFVPVATS